MRLRYSVAMVVCAATLALSSRVSADWLTDGAQYIGSTGLDLIQFATDQAGNRVQALPYVKYLLQSADYVSETTNREVTTGETWAQAAREQVLIDLSGFLVSKGLGSLLADCFAVGSCVLTTAGGVATLGTGLAIAGIGYDALVAQKITEAKLDINLNQQKLAAALQQIQRLQQRVEQ